MCSEHAGVCICVFLAGVWSILSQHPGDDLAPTFVEVPQFDGGFLQVRRV